MAQSPHSTNMENASLSSWKSESASDQPSSAASELLASLPIAKQEAAVANKLSAEANSKPTEGVDKASESAGVAAQGADKVVGQGEQGVDKVAADNGSDRGASAQIAEKAAARQGTEEVGFTLSGDDHDSWADKARREAGLIKEGLKGTKEALKDSVSKENRLETAAEVTGAGALGLGLAYLGRGRGLGLVAGKAIGIAGGAAFLKETASHGKEALGAVADTWRSDDNFEQDKSVMRNSIGRFTADTLLMSAGGMAGSAAGHHLFKPKIPPLFYDQFNYDTGIRMDYYNAFNASEMKVNMLLNPSTSRMPDSLLSKFRAELPTKLRDTLSYTDYWNKEIAAFEKIKGTKLDAKGIKNTLVESEPGAKQLDELVADIRTFATKDLDNPATLNQLVDRYQRGRTIIYGADNKHQTRRMVLGGDEQLGSA